MFKRSVCIAFVAAVSVAGASLMSYAQDRREARAGALNDSSERARMNEWTVGLAAGLPDGGFVRFASEMARTMEDGDKMRLIPMVTRGATSNIADLLYLRGVDIAITYADAFDFYRTKPGTRNIDDRVRYIMQFFVSDIHIYARKEFKSLSDLKGKKVAVGTPAVAAALTGPLIFERLGIPIETVPVGGPIALEKLRKGEISAMVYVAAKPSELFAGMKADPALHFLPVPFSEKFEDYYYPSRLSTGDYPGMLTQESEVETIAVPSVLAAYNWQRSTERARRVDRFVDYLFQNFDKLKKPPFHPKWKEINLAAKVPSWKRYPHAEVALERLKASLAASQSPARTAEPQTAQAQKQRFDTYLTNRSILPKSDAERDQLYKGFQEWSRKQAN